LNGERGPVAATLRLRGLQETQFEWGSPEIGFCTEMCEIDAAADLRKVSQNQKFD